MCLDGDHSKLSKIFFYWIICFIDICAFATAPFHCKLSVVCIKPKRHKLKIAYFTQPDFVKLARSSGAAQLLSIDFSHYAEFSRWCLQRKGKVFIEHGYAPGAHVLPLLALRACGSERHLSNTSRMLAVEPDNGPPRMSEHALQMKGVTAVPALVSSDGRVFCDSWEIAEYAGFDPVEPQLKRLLDEDLGPIARQLCYSYVLKEMNASSYTKLFLMPGGCIWKVFFYLGVGRYLKESMSKSMRVNDLEAVSSCREKLKQTFSELSEILRKKKTPYLGGNKPGAADFALAALASPVVSAHDYNLGKYDHVFIEMEKNDPDYLEEVTYWRNTDVGKYCLMIYENFRRDREN